MRVGLTGGIGAGKSEVARLLASYGAVVIDADALAREVVEPGTPGLAAVVAEFGPGILAPAGDLDRAALGAVVFSDADRRRALEAIVHPLVGTRAGELIAAAPAGSVVVYDVPLLVENGLQHTYDQVVVVDAEDEVRLQRVVRRGLARSDAERRMGAQAGREQRLAVADYVIDNSGDLAQLRTQVAALWTHLTSQP